MRDDFAQHVTRTVAARVGNRCSNPECRAQTSGPQVDSAKSLNLGVAAHITAASPGGPRYQPSLTPENRSSTTNAIWLCHNCAKLIDNDTARFTENTLRNWKLKAEEQAFSEIGRPGPTSLGESPVQDKWCTLDYIEAAGIAERLRQEGYRLRWARAEKLPTYTDLKGWEIVVWEQPDKSLVRFKVRSQPSEYMILLKKQGS
jgi:hypothetical protein